MGTLIHSRMFYECAAVFFAVMDVLLHEMLSCKSVSRPRLQVFFKSQSFLFVCKRTVPNELRFFVRARGSYFSILMILNSLFQLVGVSNIELPS